MDSAIEDVPTIVQTEEEDDESISLSSVFVLQLDLMLRSLAEYHDPRTIDNPEEFTPDEIDRFTNIYLRIVDLMKKIKIKCITEDGRESVAQMWYETVMDIEKKNPEIVEMTNNVDRINIIVKEFVVRLRSKNFMFDEVKEMIVIGEIFEDEEFDNDSRNAIHRYVMNIREASIAVTQFDKQARRVMGQLAAELRNDIAQGKLTVSQAMKDQSIVQRLGERCFESLDPTLQERFKKQLEKHSDSILRIMMGSTNGGDINSLTGGVGGST